MSANTLFPSCAKTIGLTGAKTALLNCFLLFLPAESVTEVRTNIYVTSFGPVSDTDMVSVFLLTIGHVLISSTVSQSAQKFSHEDENVLLKENEILGAALDDNLQAFAVRWRFLEGLHVKARASDRLPQGSLTKTILGRAGPI